MSRIVILLLLVVSLQQVAEGAPSANSSHAELGLGSSNGVDVQPLVAPCTARCPVGYVQVAVSPTTYECYSLITQQTTWESALSSCVRMGGWLTWITSKEQNDGIISYLRSLGGTVTNMCSTGIYFGMQRMVPNNCSTPMVWKGNCGEIQPVVFTSWEPGQPDCHTGSQRCGAFMASPSISLGWDDKNCTWSLCYICQAHHL